MLKLFEEQHEPDCLSQRRAIEEYYKGSGSEKRDANISINRESRNLNSEGSERNRLSLLNR